LVIGIYSNGSTDDTPEWLEQLPEVYGVEWRYHHDSEDKGCAYGTNKSIEMVADCELQIHLESDFEHILPKESGEDKMWLHRAVEHLNSGDCDYLYLRRMRDHNECVIHWWSQWMPKITEQRDRYLKCPTFWWSNNPVLFRTQALKDSGVLPLDESLDGNKGTKGWSMPELRTERPPKTWIHQWGLFVHERVDNEDFTKSGCGKHNGGCKYGFWLVYKSARFCKSCDWSKSFEDLPNHEKRFIANNKSHKIVAFHSNQLGYRGTEVGSWNYAKYNEELLGNKSLFLAPRSDKNIALERFKSRFETFIYDSWEEADEWLKEQGVDVLHMRKSGENDGLTSKHCRTVVHCAFPNRDVHGDVYCYISPWLSNKASNGELPFIPHIVEKPERCEGLRKELGIPDTANVFGWIGAPDSFNLQAGFDAIKELCNDGKTWFVFVGIPKFIDSPQVKFLPVTWDEDVKRRFVFTCDAMLQARAEGETFGLAVAEFSSAGRPVVTWNGGIGKAHLDLLGDKAITYEGSHDLVPILRDWSHKAGDEWDVYSDRFSPKNVMQKFKEVCGL
jgi:glycosyltransferase involved in cell wall biosynthesis